MKYLNLATSLLAVVLLNGCLEVEDNDNSEIQTLIDNQTQAITESKHINGKGVVVDARDYRQIKNALITVKAGSKIVIEDFVVDDGDFELTGLPQNSDIDIIISSADNTFLARTFFIKTDSANSEGITDLGTFPVSEGVDVEISVIDNATSAAFSTLEFTGYSHSGIGSSGFKYQHVSSFNEDTGIYTITLPKFINTGVSASLDFDKDGEVDYAPEKSWLLRGLDLHLSSANNKAFSTIYINEVEPASALEIRLSLVDEAAQSITGATFYIEDNIVKSSYDEVSNQYVITTQIKDTVSIQLPAFTSNDVNYQSTAIIISKLEDGNLSIAKNGGYNNCCFIIPNTNVIDFALAPQVNLASDTPLEVVLSSSKINATDDSFSVFYSQPIEVEAENVLLTARNGFTVLKGNENDDDLILPGTSIISSGVSVPVTFALSLNDTRLTVTPTNALIAGESYKYEVGSIINKVTQEIEDINNDELIFELEENTEEVFYPADIKLDNENFTTNGVVITATNTAGDTSSTMNGYNSTYLYLPNSISTLQNLTLRQLSVTRNGISSIDTQNYQIVIDGQINVGSVGIVSLAQNENYSIEGNYFRDVIVSSAQAETQKVYRTYTYIYSSDNTNIELNSVSFEYSVETKAGEVSTGNITIPVQ